MLVPRRFLLSVWLDGIVEVFLFYSRALSWWLGDLDPWVL